MRSKSLRFLFYRSSEQIILIRLDIFKWSLIIQIDSFSLL